jgi:TPR repeat protein/serine/threonine protein kinase
MRIHRGDEPCPYCGTLRGDLPKSTLYLPHSAVLEGRYFLGNPLWSSSFLIAYMGWDSLRSERCTLVEYHPQSLVRRVPERKLVLPVTPSKAEAFSEGRELFRRESEILASFDKEPSLIPLWNFFDFGGSIWRVTEYGEGRSLGEFFQNLQAPLPWEQAYRLLSPVVLLLHQAFEKYDLPCNLGPWSLRVRSQDRALLLGDYGMVRREWDEKQEKSLPLPLGGYSPFEFYRGKEPSERSTLFTLGALLFRMSTGEFLTDPVEWIDSEMTLPREDQERIPPTLQEVLLRGLAFRPEDRYSGIREFWSLLGKVLGEEDPFGAFPLASLGEEPLSEDGYSLLPRESLEEVPLRSEGEELGAGVSRSSEEASREADEEKIEKAPEESPERGGAKNFPFPEDLEVSQVSGKGFEATSGDISEDFGETGEKPLFEGVSPEEEEEIYEDPQEGHPYWLIGLSLGMAVLLFLGGLGIMISKQDVLRRLVNHFVQNGVEQVDPVLLNERGGDYYYGRGGVSRDYAEAAKLYAQAADLGYPASQFNYGVLLYYGRGVSEDKDLGIRWIRTAAGQKLDQAEEFLHKRDIPLEAPEEEMTEGDGEPSPGTPSAPEVSSGDPQEGKSSPLPESPSPSPSPTVVPTQGPTPTPTPEDLVFRARTLFEAGEFERSLEIFEKAYERGSGEAAFYLGKAFVEGKGVAVNLGKAALWFRLGSEKDHDHSKAMLYYLNPGKFGEYESLYRELYPPTPTPEPTATPTPEPTATPTPEPTATPTPEPTATPTPEPTATPTPEPTATPTPEPTATPTPEPTATPTPEPLEELESSGEPEAPRASAPSPLPVISIGGTPAVTLTPEERFLLGEQLFREGNHEEARREYQYAADHGHREARYALGMLLLENSSPADLVQGMGMIRLAAIQGHVEAKYELARGYASGRGVEKDPDLAELWYKRAAESGSPRGQYYFAQKYYRGGDTLRDYSLAASWMKQAAERGYAPAQKEYGDMYARGHGVPWSETEAAAWYARGANRGYPPALHLLGRCYLEGKGVPLDPARGASLLKKSAAEGYAPAQADLGQLYWEGRGVSPQDDEALRYFRMAAEDKVSSALYYLGKAYEEGRGVSKSGETALEWYQRGAEEGSPDAQYSLGLFYFYGRNVQENRLEAEKWLRKASDQGHGEAKKFLQSYY